MPWLYLCAPRSLPPLLLDRAQARLHPEHPVASLSDDQINALHASLTSVLDLAVLVDSDSNRFPVDWLFHFRWSGKKPASLNGMPIHFVTVSYWHGRGHFTDIDGTT